MVRRALSGALPPSRLQGGPKVQGGKITWQSLPLFGLMGIFGGAGPAFHFTMAPLRQCLE